SLGHRPRNTQSENLSAESAIHCRVFKNRELLRKSVNRAFSARPFRESHSWALPKLKLTCTFGAQTPVREHALQSRRARSMSSSPRIRAEFTNATCEKA